MLLSRASNVVLLVVVVFAFAPFGCDDKGEIRTYQAPKAPAPAVHRDGSDERPTWAAPAGWKELSPGAMQVATFQVDASDANAKLTVTPLGAESGELLPNVNRWEGQLGLPPSKAEDLGKVTRTIDVNGVSATRVDLTGPTQRTLAAIVPHGGRVWYFKLSGEAKTVGAHEEEFDAFVASVSFHGEREARSASTRPAEAGRAAEAPSGEPTWDVPAGWTKDADRPMRFATFKTSGDAGAPEVIVSSFGAFGSMKDNINRWRGMVGLAPVDDEKQQPVTPITVGGNEGALFDMTGPAKDGQPAKRLVLAMAPAGRAVWFFRMTGTADAVEQQKANFDAFVKSVKFGE